VTTYFAPGWRGAERIVLTTVATAACSPCSAAASIASRIERSTALGYCCDRFAGRAKRRSWWHAT
jgi:hypothetical protein